MNAPQIFFPLIVASLFSAVAVASDTPQEAAERHMAALMSLNNVAIAETIFFPFVHIRPDGNKNLMRSAADLPDMQGLPYRTKLTRVDVTTIKGSTAVLYVEFQRHDLDGNPTRTGSAIWGATRSGTGWLISWRQFLGLDGDG